MLAQMTRRDRGDARALANQWEFLLQGLDYPTRRFAVNCAHALATAYLRAQGIKFGGKLTMEKLQTNGILVLAMVETVVERGPAFYPTLYRMGWVSVDEASAIMEGILGGKDAPI